MSQFFLRIRSWITNYTIRHWKNILLFNAAGVVYIVILSLIIIFVGSESQEEKLLAIVSIFTGILFGLFTIAGLAASIAVLHEMRGLIPHYSLVGEKFQSIIRSANHSIYVMTTNPAFLQVLDNKSFVSWSKLLKEQLTEKRLINKVVFCYMERPRLADEIKSWAAGDEAKQSAYIKQIVNDFVFNWCSSADNYLSACVRLVPLDSKDLPYFISVIDDDKKSMFCKADIESEIGRSDIKGFITEVNSVSSALLSVYRHTLELHGIVYEYVCQCNHEPKYYFDHDLAKRALIREDNFSEIPNVKCAGCKKEVEGKRRLINDLDQQVRTSVLARVF